MSLVQTCRVVELNRLNRFVASAREVSGDTRRLAHEAESDLRKFDWCPEVSERYVGCSALDGYIGAMEAWVDAVAKGRSVEGLIPVNVPATPENAELLGGRLSFLDREILCDYEADLKESST